MTYSCELSPTCKSVTFEFKIYFNAPARVNTDNVSREVNGEARALFNDFITDNHSTFSHGSIYKMEFSKNRLTKGQRSHYYGYLTIPVKQIPGNIDNIARAFEIQLMKLDTTINNKLKANATDI